MSEKASLYFSSHPSSLIKQMQFIWLMTSSIFAQAYEKKTSPKWRYDLGRKRNFEQVGLSYYLIVTATALFVLINLLIQWPVIIGSIIKLVKSMGFFLIKQQKTLIKKKSIILICLNPILNH